MGEDEETTDDVMEHEMNCESCGEFGYNDEMVDCSRFEEDLEEKGTYPGHIHKRCCRDEFINDPQGCMEYCQDDEALSRNIQENFETCICGGLVKGESKNRIPIFTNKENTFLVTAKANDFLEPFKPLNVVTSTFSDEEAGIFYVKDNEKNVTIYSSNLIDEVKNRLKIFDTWGFEQFCIPKGPFCIVYDIGDLSIGGTVAPRTSDEGIDTNKIGMEMATKYKEKYAEAEDFFGVKIRTDRESIKLKIQTLSENELINIVLVPILCAQGFRGVKPVSFHGPAESGGDFHPFYKIDEFGKIIYYSAQAKAIKIHATAAKQEGNVNRLINQVDELFRTSFKSFNDNTERKITRAFVFSSQNIAPDARNQLFFAFENRQTISLVEIDDIVTAVLENDLSDQILTYLSAKEENKLNKENTT
jgi:hypothetical protein